MLKRLTFLSLVLFLSLAAGAAPQESGAGSAGSKSETTKSQGARRLTSHVTLTKMPAAQAAHVRASLKWQGAPHGKAGAVATRVRPAAGGVTADIVPAAPETAVTMVNPDGTLSTTCSSPQEATTMMKSARQDKNDGSRQ